MSSSASLDEIVELIADRIAERVIAAITPRPAERVPLVNVAASHGVSARWIQARARDGKISLRGPRGARFVERVELDRLLASETIRRRPKVVPINVPIADAARAAVSELAARRGRAA
jgi:hypothetical protein